MSDSKIKTIAVLTSGGDAPGMNAAIRSVVRTGIARGLKVWGIQRGYAGLLEGAFREMDASSVGNILQHGGTILQTSRCPEFHQAETRREAVNLLKRKKIDGLIVIGGDGSFNGAHQMWLEHQFPVVGIPGTIDNDISGTEYTIGFDTAVQTAIEAVDKIRDTASSHARTFIVEVMGRRSPAIALHTGVCTGAENIVLPSENVDPSQIASDIQRGVKRGKNSSIIIVAEGEKPGLVSYQIQESLKKDHQIDAHVCVLGHIQRGGHPSAIDRFLAARMGYEAVERMIAGEYPVVSVYVNGHVGVAPLSECLKKRVESAPGHLELARTLSI
ncbi:MAG: 6-phosphofructokinase [Bdellovibrionales bacterium CG12_big_fil_rev_8_21_14_0_65_38_15]|nr:MAG: 6-phosphofructokinase [Bdellovibrionales bacterium CG22_combo_CG10-13_8_21_14_all_38_13]PIQ54557.1 MAG: 6-phosphofructokinase [Bdellovibrionales bacterium CG12_big_fil_rev_8_21_14_0_65_38_15]PIR29938.1 MAG: 6-phosphofructokinase [Bdellovibrionales bacterium CG11_big_fil_rev_8_21_14_0_20_38_13]